MSEASFGLQCEQFNWASVSIFEHHGLQKNHRYSSYQFSLKHSSVAGTPPETMRKSVSWWFAMAFPDPPGPRNSPILEFGRYGVIWSDQCAVTLTHNSRKPRRVLQKQILSNLMCSGLRLISLADSQHINIQYMRSWLFPDSSNQIQLFNKDRTGQKQLN